MRKHVKNHSKEEQEQVRLSRDTDTSQEGQVGWQEPLSYHYSQYNTVGRASTERGDYDNTEPLLSPLLSPGVMVHQPNSLDSLDGEPSLPFDPVPIRYESGPGDGLLPRIDEQTNIFSMK